MSIENVCCGRNIKTTLGWKHLALSVSKVAQGCLCVVSYCQAATVTEFLSLLPSILPFSLPLSSCREQGPGHACLSVISYCAFSEGPQALPNP